MGGQVFDLKSKTWAIVMYIINFIKEKMGASVDDADDLLEFPYDGHDLLVDTQEEDKW